ncbi:MAG: RNA polymerase-binding protein DksA [Burkholderiaceae bacterium]|nr:RNA polymerase-binding protein DksA [Burkholderiaceae bacterium]
MAAAKKPAKKIAKSAPKGAKKAIRKVAKKVAKKVVKKMSSARTSAGGKAAAGKAKGSKTLKSAPAKKPTAVKGRVPSTVGKSAMPIKAPPPGRPRGGRPARAGKEQRQIPPMPAPGLASPTAITVAPKVVPAPSPKALAAAHEYLLARSATRSEAPVLVNGKRLPTEEQLLKMRDTDYMSGEQLAYFKYRLQGVEAELLQNADQTTEHLRESVIVPDPADRATIEEEHALELRTRDRERKLLKKVQQALARIEAGDYGYCEETGEPIGVPRLLARPTATLSLEAQQRRELKQKMFGD